MILTDLVLPIRYTESDLISLIGKHMRREPVRSFRILKRSIDARKKPDLKFVITVAVNEALPEPEPDPISEPLLPIDPVCVVGSGPAGLFAAFTLLKHRIPLILLERGKPVEERVKDVDAFFMTGILDPESNVQFGEGGAGTFSDGKLNTGNKRSEDHETVLRTFVECGAPGEILYDAKPHIGTDRLREMIPNFRKRITALGGEFRFQSQFTGFRCDENGRVSALEINGTEWIRVSALVPAIGHSARDTYRMLLEKGVRLTPKAFAVGLRIEHEERMITLDRYGTLDYPELGAAPYKLTYHAKDGRGVYSFCMCPGGFVVNASSEEGRTVVNGMSDYMRNAVNSNSAIVVQVTPSDYPGDSVLSGIRFQEILEEQAYHAGNGRIPVQRFDDFLLNRKTVSFGSVFPSAKGGFTMGEVNSVFPEFIRNDIAESISYFGRIIRGFDNGDAILSAVESRTSSPVRIERDEKYESNIRGLFPAGEGAGYAGGILSSASDGIRTAEAVARSLGVLR